VEMLFKNQFLRSTSEPVSMYSSEPGSTLQLRTSFYATVQNQSLRSSSEPVFHSCSEPDGRAYSPDVGNRPVVHALDILTAVIINDAVIWDLSLCNLTDADPRGRAV
jgi:hypothetical protein